VHASFWRSLSRAGPWFAGSDPRPRARVLWPQRSPCGALRFGTLPPHQACRCRRRFRTTTTGRTRAPSLGSTRTSRSEQARPCSLFARTGIAPAPYRSPRASARLVKDWLVASSYPALRRAASRRARRDEQRGRCVSPTSATDSLHEHPADCSVPGCARLPRPTLRRAATPRASYDARGSAGYVLGLSLTGARLGCLPIRLTGRSRPGGASLDGEPPASVAAAIVT